jgi:WhiB family redox-sensing transcriptional regulator
MIEFAAEWRGAGACLSADPDLFFPVAVGAAAGRDVPRALLICDGCSVKRQCLDFAIKHREESGIWGGTTPDQRLRVLRQRNRRPARRPWRETVTAQAS